MSHSLMCACHGCHRVPGLAALRPAQAETLKPRRCHSLTEQTRVEAVLPHSDLHPSDAVFTPLDLSGLTENPTTLSIHSLASLQVSEVDLGQNYFTLALRTSRSVIKT
ncbi:hypothetical protein ElyMa_006764000 [Elysia marginata]|uniref:Uncharacterized protein n=1 Tax=Elysia marginata TaxID=1093978 RepID=A0AAV4IX80_9GAST|nr:hypothetical protein ElyMa_006764000 [Elysia marginata]